MTITASRLCLVVGIVLLSTGTSATSPQRRDDSLPFSCAVFARTISAVDIAVRFGAGNVMNQLKGEREYSSGHPAMQALNPTVSELFLQYDYRQ